MDNNYMKTILSGVKEWTENLTDDAVDKANGTHKDWNENDPTQPGYIENRPFYTGDPVETVLVEESTVSFVVSNHGIYVAEFESTFEAIVGETYKVSWDGTVYECTCVNFSGEVIIGNLSIAGAGSDTGEPFLMGVPRGICIIYTLDTSASHIISISGPIAEVVKIDEKYLPEDLATKSDVEAARTTANNAQTTANNAQTTANNARTTANNARTTANNAQTTANNAKSEANNAQTTANNAQTTANNAKSEALDLAARMFGHTSVVDKAFYKCTTLTLTSLPSVITSIGDTAFGSCTNLALTSLPDGLTSIGDNVFEACSNLALTSLPSGITSIGKNAFRNCTKLALTSLPSGITSIGKNAFRNCTKLALTSLPSGITSISDSAFKDCTGLTSITFTGTPTTIDSLAFKGCTNLTTINVPWAEGEVANAPWGATNATINYNYTET